MNDHKITVKADNLNIGYRRGSNPVTVASNICGALSSCELTCLLGPNGAGKSTLLRTLTGYQPPLGGDVMLFDKPLTAYTPGQISRSIGVVLTERISVQDMTARQVVETGRSPYTGFWGTLSSADKDIVEKSMEAVGIAALADKPISDLSDGERQKVMIAKALAQQTPVVFLDEPTAFLDYPSKVDTMRLLRDLARERGMTVFMSTHDIGLALDICDRAWLMDYSGQVTIGTPDVLIQSGILEKILKFAPVG